MKYDVYVSDNMRWHYFVATIEAESLEAAESFAVNKYSRYDGAQTGCDVSVRSYEDKLCK